MRLLVALLRLFPETAAAALFRVLSALAFALRIRRRVALENLKIAFPDLPETERFALARAHYAHLGRCAGEFLRCPAMSDEELFRRVDPVGYDATMARVPDSGMIFCTAHLGNFELFGAYCARRGLEVTLLTRKLAGAANRAWTGTRTASGVKEVHKGIGALVALLRRKEAVAILIDQNMLKKRAVFVPFLGRLAATTPLPALLAERTGANVMLGVLFRLPDGRYRTVFEGPFAFERTGGGRKEDVRRFTALLNERLEMHVRAHPEQWFWVHRRFKTRPDA